MGVHTKLQNQIEKTKQAIKATVPPKIMERADQVLLELSHTGQTIPNLLKQTFKKIEGNPHDVIGRLSRTVIERAESVRSTLSKSMMKSATSFTVEPAVPAEVVVEAVEAATSVAATSETATSAAAMPKKKTVRKKSGVKKATTKSKAKAKK